MKIARRRSFWDVFLEKLFIALIDEGLKNPDRPIGRWVIRVLIAAAILFFLFVFVAVFLGRLRSHWGPPAWVSWYIIPNLSAQPGL